MSALKVILSVLAAIGLAVFLVLWILTRSELADTRAKLKTATDGLQQSETARQTAEQALAKSDSALKSAQGELERSAASITAKDKEISNLNDRNRSLTNQLSDLEIKIQEEAFKAAETSAPAAAPAQPETPAPAETSEAAPSETAPPADPAPIETSEAAPETAPAPIETSEAAPSETAPPADPAPIETSEAAPDSSEPSPYSSSSGLSSTLQTTPAPDPPATPSAPGFDAEFLDQLRSLSDHLIALTRERDALRAQLDAVRSLETCRPVQ